MLITRYSLHQRHKTEAGYGPSRPTSRPSTALYYHHYCCTSNDLYAVLYILMPVAVPKTDYYAVLDLEKGATEEEIRVAYKKLVSWHCLEVSK